MPSNQASNGGQKEDKKNYYSAHNVANRLSFGTMSVHKGNHGNVVGIFMGLSCELYCQ